MNIPAVLHHNLLTLYHDKAHAWFAALPNFIQSFEKKWGFKTSECYADAHYNYVAPVVLSDNQHAVLKACIPNPQFTHEILALQHFKGQGAIKVLYADIESGIALLEKVEPGVLLENHTDTQQALQFAVDVSKKLHQPLNDIPTHFPTLADWFKRGFERLYKTFLHNTGPFPKYAIEKAVALSNDLLASIEQPLVLHADLHYANILFSTQRGWLAIDPHGVIGEVEFENPLPRLNKVELTKSMLAHHFSQYCELTGYDKNRVLGWAYAKSVLAAWWSYEDHGMVGIEFLRFAEMLAI